LPPLPGTYLAGSRAVTNIGLSGSFARTGKGHGTDKTLVAGLLDMASDDERIRDSFVIASSLLHCGNIVITNVNGMETAFSEVRIPLFENLV
jgi:L-serine deaminase